MNHLLRNLTCLLCLCCLTALAGPAQAARLASIEGEAGETKVTESAEFKLSEQVDVDIKYDIEKIADGCSAQVRVCRKQNGEWLIVATVARAANSTRGSRGLTLPAGDYKIEVVAQQCKFSVTVDN